MTTLRDVELTQTEEILKKFLDLDILEACNPKFMEQALSWDKTWEKNYRRLWKTIRAGIEKIKANRKIGSAILVFEQQPLLCNELIGRKDSNTRRVFLALVKKFGVETDLGDNAPQPLSKKAKDVLELLKTHESTRSNS